MKLATTRRLDYIVTALTIISMIPFENGPISLVIPTTWKPYVIAFGVLAKIILSEVKAQTTAEKPTDPKP